MLILKRQQDEEIYVGDDVHIVVIDVERRENDNDVAVLGIEAPEDVPILRDELIDDERRKRELKENASADERDLGNE